MSETGYDWMQLQKFINSFDRPRVRLSLLTEMGIRNLPGGRGLSVYKDDNLTAICELIAYKVWEPRRLTIPWASMASYRESSVLLK
jgi:hypothetical protein